MMAPIPLVAGRFKSAQYAGLGGCPAGLYDNITNPGFCTNLTPDAQRMAAGGGSVATSSAPVVFDPAIVAANSAAGFGLQLTPDEATQRALVAEAEAEGAARGIPTHCEIVVNESPASGGLPASRLYQALCTVAGSVDRQSAAQLVRSGGFAQVLPGDPRGVDAPRVAAILTASPGGGGFNQTGNTAATSNGAPLPVTAAGGDGGLVLPDIGGLPSWAIWAAAAAAAVYVIGGHK